MDASLQDFAEVAAAHERFLETLKTQSLLLVGSLHGSMHLVLALCRQLCALVKGARERGVDMGAVQVQQFNLHSMA